MSVWKTKASAGGDYPKAPPGNHPAALVAIVDLGDQEDEYQGVKRVQRRAYFCWELIGVTVNGSADNHLIGIDLTVSLNEKAKLRQWIESWRGRKIADGDEFDISKMLGAKCLLSVAEHKGYPKISGVAAVPKGMNVGNPTHKPFLFSTEENIKADGSFEIPDWLPYCYGDKIGDIIASRIVSDGDAKEPAKTDSGSSSSGEEIPF